MDTAAALAFYRNHLEEVILPFWSRALDHEYGGVYTCFNNSGDTLLSRDKYIWSQGRFLWLWSKAAAMTDAGLLRGDSDDYLEHLRKTVSFLERHAFLENGNCAFVITRTGEKKEAKPGQGYDVSIFADCFMALGLAAFAGVTGDKNRFETALEVYRGIRGRLGTGNYRSEPYPVPKGYRAHSIPMIMLNVAQSLAEVAETVAPARSDKLHQNSLSYMYQIMDEFCRQDHTVAEMLPESAAEQDTLLSRHINPGHTLESMWFVIHTARENGLTATVEQAAQVIEKTARTGWDEEYGGLLRFADRQGGKPQGRKTTDSRYEALITDAWDMKLWWPHSEALYATLLAGTLTGNNRLFALHDTVRDYTFNTFPHPDASTGEWIQIRDRTGEPLDKIAALPVKDPFHILRNLLLIVDLLAAENERGYMS